VTCLPALGYISSSKRSDYCYLTADSTWTAHSRFLRSALTEPKHEFPGYAEDDSARHLPHGVLSPVAIPHPFWR